jgi:hypothetical protein
LKCRHPPLLLHSPCFYIDFVVRVDDMGRDILASAKHIVLRCQNREDTEAGAAQLEAQLTKKVDKLEHQLAHIQSQLDQLLNRSSGL